MKVSKGAGVGHEVCLPEGKLKFHIFLGQLIGAFLHPASIAVYLIGSLSHKLFGRLLPYCWNCNDPTYFLGCVFNSTFITYPFQGLVF